MKHLKSLLSLIILSAITLTAFSQAPSNLLDWASVGESGSFDKIDVTMPAGMDAVRVSFEVVKYNLCPSHAAVADIYVNGVAKKSIMLKPGLESMFTVFEGSKISVDIQLQLINTTVKCSSFGNVRMGLFQVIK